ncbi:riboflavin synthase [Caldifermentibacillus hisashii]|uniref:riboflavin synthase n=1 Tax=Bacillaceae TaxID=186817 RepID=UPI000D551345|nr:MULTISPECIES: riboflavin synthase [Bacillaceae]AWI13137.1 riboflavin synthase [Caldibacillus thermoamylovorans]MED3644879.1 riboflavin synthase [Caldifermentibacillus hisashii]
MFTGIIEELGTIQRVKSRGNTLVLNIQAKKVLEDLKLGDSISVNGVCLTVTELTHDSFFLDVMPETFHSTSLSNLQQGSQVNLERAMSSNGRFGGHFVTGHVDTVGQIVKRERKENAVYFDIQFPYEYSHLPLYKGSIALDGTSLTIFGTSNNQLTVSIIPHTAKESVLGTKKVGDKVNIEFDLIGKYVYSFMERKDPHNYKDKISIDFLKENGFM